MDKFESLNHTKWECKYHVVFIPKCRRRTLYGQLRQYLGEVFRKLAQQKESRIEEGQHFVPISYTTCWLPSVETERTTYIGAVQFAEPGFGWTTAVGKAGWPFHAAAGQPENLNGRKQA
jgi:hypothetical protein